MKQKLVSEQSQMDQMKWIKTNILLAEHQIPNSDQNQRTYHQVWIFNELHRCWWQMFETKFIGDNFKMLVTVLAILVTSTIF